jgi:hypothetical protein
MPEKQHRSLAKIEFLACRPEIEKLLDEGSNMALVYDMLAEKKKITMGYQWFCKYIRRYGLGPEQPAQKKGGPARPSGPLPARSPAPVRSVSRKDIGTPGTPFIHDPRPDPAWFKEAKNETVGES